MRMNIRLPYNTEKRCGLLRGMPQAHSGIISSTLQQILPAADEKAADWLTRMIFVRALNQCRARGAEDCSAEILYLLPEGTAEQWLRARLAGIRPLEELLSATALTAAADPGTAQNTAGAARPQNFAGAGTVRKFAGADTAKHFSCRIQTTASVSAQIAEPVVTVTVTGQQICPLSRPENPEGWSVIAAGSAGESGSAVLAEVRHTDLSAHFSENFLSGAVPAGLRHFCIPSAAALAGRPEEGRDDLYVCAVGEGGIFAALWYLAEGWNRGFSVRLPEIPIRQETIEICDVFACNPYQMASDGCALTVTCRPARVLECFRAAGFPAQVIGTIRADRDKIIENRGEIRYLDRPAADTLAKGLEFPVQA